MWLLVLDGVGLLSALVLFLTAVRMIEVAEHFEFSIRVGVAAVIGVGSAWSMAAAFEPGHLHPAHVGILLGGALWVAQAVYRHRNAPVRHPGQRRTDFGHLDSLASGGKKR